MRGVLPRNYGREGLDKGRLGQLVDLIGSIGFTETDDHGSDDVLGRVYEYFLGQFAGKETGKDAGAFYTPRSIVKTLVEMLEPFHGRVYDPACGSGGMFVQSAEFVKAHGGKRTDISIYGQEFTDTTWKLAKMNLALRGIEADLGDRSADSFTQDLHPDLRADFVLANPPFNVSNWWDPKLADDPRWKYGTPPEGNANFAWVQHFIYHLSPKGTAGFVLANGSLVEQEQRRGRHSAQARRSTTSSTASWRCRTSCSSTPASRSASGSSPRTGTATATASAKAKCCSSMPRRLGAMETRRLRVLTDDDIAKIAGTYHAWRNHDGGYEDVPGFARAASLDEIRQHDFVLTPGRYVGKEEAEADNEPIQDKIERLTKELLSEFDRGRDLEDVVRSKIEGLCP